MFLRNYFWLCCLCVLSACSTAPVQPPNIAAPANSTAYRVIDDAYSWLGTPYEYGGSSKSGVDCSGLVYEVYSQAHVYLPRTAYRQSRAGYRIARSQAQPGDLIFFRTTGHGISHVGIVDQVNGHELRFIHASESEGVIISSSENVYWKPRIVEVVRVLQH